VRSVTRSSGNSPVLFHCARVSCAITATRSKPPWNTYASNDITNSAISVQEAPGLCICSRVRTRWKLANSPLLGPSHRYSGRQHPTRRDHVRSVPRPHLGERDPVPVGLRLALTAEPTTNATRWKSHLGIWDMPGVRCAGAPHDLHPRAGATHGPVAPYPARCGAPQRRPRQEDPPATIVRQ